MTDGMQSPKAAAATSETLDDARLGEPASHLREQAARGDAIGLRLAQAFESELSRCQLIECRVECRPRRLCAGLGEILVTYWVATHRKCRQRISGDRQSQDCVAKHGLDA